MIDFKRLLRSFSDAIDGLRLLIAQEQSIRIEFIIGGVVLLGSIILPLTIIERSIILLLIFIVIIAEILNTLIERIVDVLNSKKDERIKQIKHKSAALVLLLSLLSAVIGFIIFAPYLIVLFN